MNIAGRVARTRLLLKDLGLDAVLVSSRENRKYLSGFTGSDGYLLISQDESIIATDFRYTEQASLQAPGCRIERIGGGREWLLELVSRIGLRRIGYEEEHLTVSVFTKFTKSLNSASPDPPELVPVSDAFEGLRASKDAGEVAQIERAIEIADQAFEEVAVNISPGMTEREIAWRLECAMRSRGAEGVSFPVIVAAGPRCAMAHCEPDHTQLHEGQTIVIDMGALLDGYCSDLTRTLCLGAPDVKFKEIYNIVSGAQAAAIEGIRSGMTGNDADAIARNIITAAGYGDAFGHSLGHGVGLAIHERPRVGPRSEDRLEDGMIFSIEPGIYLTDWGGVRIEDLVVLHDGRVKVLSKAKKLVLGV